MPSILVSVEAMASESDALGRPPLPEPKRRFIAPTLGQCQRAQRRPGAALEFEEVQSRSVAAQNSQVSTRASAAEASLTSRSHPSCGGRVRADRAVSERSATARQQLRPLNATQRVATEVERVSTARASRQSIQTLL